MKKQQNKMEKITSFLKDSGFINLSSEPYGGFASSYDYGPYGVEIKNNLKSLWWNDMTRNHENIVGLDSAILMSPKIWEASGHLSAGFADELSECKKCHKRFKEDSLENKNICPECQGELMAPKKFNIMMKTFVGAVEDSKNTVYLRGETCQGIYMNFLWAKNACRLKIPFGLCQIGKAFRNEITPGPFVYRTREFEQMEMQFFVKEADTEKWFDFWKKARLDFYLKLGLKKENLRFKEQQKEELAHYAKKAVDIEYHFPFGWCEIEGIHYRGDWDLANHSKHSGVDLSYKNLETKESFIPHVIETSAGCDRSLLAFLIDSFCEFEQGRKNDSEHGETMLALNTKLSPIKIAVLPLMKNKPELTSKAHEIYQMMRPCFSTQYDETGSIGKRYRRQDEIGTPYCVTVDFETLENNSVTLRKRDDMSQERIALDDLKNILSKDLC